MALTNNIVEQIIAWCGTSEVLTDPCQQAKSEFYGDNEPGDVRYIAETGEFNARNRRFLGWFGFSYRLPDNNHPAETAVIALLNGPEQLAAIESVRHGRFVLAIVTTVIPGKSVYLELEDEEFQLDSKILTQIVTKGDALCAHIIPIGRRKWLACPGWLVWPFRLGPNMRDHLKEFQIKPIELERLLQQRSHAGGKNPIIKYPQDRNFTEAVARMTREARKEGCAALIKSEAEWQTMVLADMKSKDITKFSKDIMKLIGQSASLNELNKWIGLALNIWNNTPQPDRNDRTANEMIAETGQPPNQYKAA
jgi:hypothetical protein